ncbi:HlyD family efflux transporter periplasmic adaptor subunit [Desulfosporosinus fructosivorans]|uniref:HlyD family efflux transporter periplasmic adaptor subunit n=1 Tax=Desulfosporosinus fructosivorans TaxID=2018669 RepID=A0A4Z0R903_9FIRM|nr:HlyD family efflux transporter periplasmic adaptor subunit [Desulfosporosinus fructosivorans]TGE38934.1 HlyD family efflux transporter periplasmic adaptor subunit [Desulfosporosinus fructosivorans]
MKNKKTGNKKVIIWSVIGLLAVASGITLYAMPQKTSYTEVKTTTGNLATNYSFSGSIEAKNRQTVFADKTMQIKTIKVQEGEQVSTDTVLMTTIIGGEMKSKIAGEVSSIYVDENAQIMPGAKLLDIVDYSDLQLKVQVDEYDLSAVSNGKDATVTIHSIKEDVNGKITTVSKEGEYANGVTTFTATISLANDSNLRVGMSAEAKVLNQSVTNVVLLPMTAIQFDANNSPYVLIKDSNNAPRTVAITLGLNDGVHAEIKSGVTANDTVLVPPIVTPTGFGPGSQMRQSTPETQTETPQEGSGGARVNE